ncbi:DUF2157 domain-containing protein [Psychroserpens sp. NJDZ02]|uniref:DUF2157 domain-containing protein n=1 Tax=Psychroserpens sp. NJDZ02 TaxID=2570561 RepID=UPI0010A82A9C|nr:DUF2157 domain-containing protein [Psychroserpens sp. NJDZ02]QCE42334.1 DUF2157 domain-containing protein [Psychroserpens sp. NJDZ02]
MTKIDREDIHIIGRHSNWKQESIDTLLKQEIYSNQIAWQKFLKLFFISLGVGFTTAGILFFFAYNWADLHKFVKIGLVEGLITATTLIVLFSKLNSDIKNIILTGASILVGVLFAVFGQIYQTGANAYDFFLGWTVFITLWVAISNFAPLWFIFIILINTTLVLYTEQVANDWSIIFNATLFFVINALFLVTALLVKEQSKTIKIPIWFTNSVALIAVCFSTAAINEGIYHEQEFSFFVLLFIIITCYIIGIKYGLKVKSSFYLSIIPFSVIILICSLLLKLSHSDGIYFIIALFIISSITLVIKNLISLQKKWTN